MRSGSWRPLRPTNSSNSASISSCSTPSTAPTLSASRPSLAAPANSPSASNTVGGTPSMSCGLAATDAADTVLMAVGPPVLGLGSHPSRFQPERTRREDRRLQVLRATGQPRVGAVVVVLGEVLVEVLTERRA